MKKYICVQENKEFNSIKEVADFIKAKYENVKRYFTRNKSKSEVTIKDFTFKVIYQPSVITILNREFKKSKKEKNFNLENFKNLWKDIIKNNPNNQQYQDFNKFFNSYLLLNKNKFNFLDLIIKWNNECEVWMCDTETTFTSLVPEQFLFKDVNKAYGDNAQETISNLHIQQITNKKELLNYSLTEREKLTKKGIKDWFNENPNIKPYMWAWNAYNFVNKDYVIFNYNNAVKYLNTYPKRVLQYYHNLSYDAYYVCNALIEEFNYQIILEPTYEEKQRIKNEEDYYWRQPKKTIIILANENKILCVKICNSLGKIITMECTYLKLLASVDKIGKILNIPKLEINYMTPRSKDHEFTQKELDYIFTDVKIIVNYMNDVADCYYKRFNKKLKWLLTLGQTSFKMLKDMFGQEKWQEMFEFKISKKTWNQIPEIEKKELYGNKRPSILNAKESEYLRKGIYDTINKTWSGGFYNGGYTNYNIKYVGMEHSNISSVDIKSSYPDKWQHYKIPYKGVLYNCNCDNNDLTNNSTHFKLFELEILEDVKILKNKENMIPVKCEALDENGKTITNIEYYPWMLKGVYPLSQYALKIFFILFNPDKKRYKIKKTMCFRHKIIDEFKNYVTLWQQEKETPNLKNDNPCYYDLCKLFLNGPTGKFGQKEITEEKQFLINVKGVIDYKMTKTKEFEDLPKFSYLPVIIATTDLARLQLLSLIETVGWDNWHNSDTDSCKFWLPEKFKPIYKPLYLNLINDNWETIYNEENKNDFGKWELEWTAPRFKCSGKKKYIYLKQEKNELIKKVVCAGAPQSVKNKMTFESFFIGYHTTENDKNRIDKLNGLPTILPTSFQIKNVFKSKNWILMSRQALLHDYYKTHLYRIEKLINENKQEINKEIIVLENEEDLISKDQSVYN